MTTVVTTFSKDGYDLYGHKMISSWIKYWPKNYKLIVYVEDFEISESDSRVEVRNLNTVCTDLQTFKKESGLMASAVTDKKALARIQKTVKWSHKVFAINHSLENCKDGYLIFLDGDTYTTTTIETNLAEKLVENHFIAVHFETLSEGLHFETGLLVFNLQHPQLTTFTQIYTDGYKTLKIYDQKKTWDTYWLVKLYKDYSLDIKDLSKNKKSSVFGNPLIYNKIIHDVGTEKYSKAGYNKFTGKKQ
jgi:hypothetical protein